jgi:hypothetical protein
MSEWDGWGLDRAVLVFAALMYAGIWVQVTLFHWAGAFKRIAMWGPVILTPVIVVGILIGVVVRDSPWGWIAAGVLAFGIIDGAVGLFYHLKGVTSQIGGFSLRNAMSGPPPVMPVAYSMVGVLGMIGLLWHA